MKYQKAFTLIELLIGIGILAVISTVAVFILNPVQMLAQGRDSTRLNDIKILNNAIKLSKVRNSMVDKTEPRMVYISLPDLSDPRDGWCDEYTDELPVLASGWKYRCQADSTSLRDINSNGWLPIDFSPIPSIQSFFNTLPVDPENIVDSFYSYGYDLNKKNYAIASILVSEKHRNTTALNDGGNWNIAYETRPVAWMSEVSGPSGWVERQPVGDYDKKWQTAAADSDGSNLIAADVLGRIYTSSDYGATWTERKPAGDANIMWKIVASDGDGSTLIAGISPGHLYISSDSGLTWNDRKPASGNANRSWEAADSSDNGLRLIVGDSGGSLYVSSDGGLSWSERKPDLAKSVYYWHGVASSSDGLKLIAGAFLGQLYTSIDGGVNWTLRIPGGVSGQDWYGVASSSDGSRLIAGAYNGRLYTSTDSGLNWTEQQPIGDTDQRWRAVTVSGDGLKLIAGNEGASGGRLYTYSD